MGYGSINFHILREDLCAAEAHSILGAPGGLAWPSLHIASAPQRNDLTTNNKSAASKQTTQRIKQMLANCVGVW